MPKYLHSFHGIGAVLLSSLPRFLFPSILLVVVLLQPAGSAGEFGEDPGEVGDPRRLEADAGVVGGKTNQGLHELNLARSGLILEGDSYLLLMEMFNSKMKILSKVCFLTG